ncbi:hypothetical protein [Nocardia miyunensis]|uniref:hypothetical protein n=1 Tax=Nocardia miyunensis TaxID=282684 RepID=UPI0008363C63|nr:hypothetical protein [Nocardia miyunensis]
MAEVRISMRLPGVFLGLVAVLVALACGLRWLRFWSMGDSLSPEVRSEVWGWRHVLIQPGRAESTVSWPNVMLVLAGLAALLAAVLSVRTRARSGDLDLIAEIAASSLVFGISLTRVLGLAAAWIQDNHSGAAQVGPGFWALVACVPVALLAMSTSAWAIDRRMPCLEARTDHLIGELLGTTAIVAMIASICPLDTAFGYIKRTSWTASGREFGPVMQLVGIALVVSVVISAAAVVLLVIGPRTRGRGYALGLAAALTTIGVVSTLLVDTIADLFEPQVSGPGAGVWLLAVVLVGSIVTGGACVKVIAHSMDTESVTSVTVTGAKVTR